MLKIHSDQNFYFINLLSNEKSVLVYKLCISFYLCLSRIFTPF